MGRPFRPEPEESGFLEPPRRRPPTAVGTATPPPPYKPGNYRHFRSTTQLIARSALAVGLGACSVASLAIHPLFWLLAGAPSLAAAVSVAMRVRGDILARKRKRAERQRRRAA